VQGAPVAEAACCTRCCGLLLLPRGLPQQLREPLAEPLWPQWHPVGCCCKSRSCSAPLFRRRSRARRCAVHAHAGQYCCICRPAVAFAVDGFLNTSTAPCVLWLFCGAAVHRRQPPGANAKFGSPFQPPLHPLIHMRFPRFNAQWLYSRVDDLGAHAPLPPERRRKRASLRKQ